eukprot:GHVS01063253.1.p1 GENE.GHVS01063253.1~~GHVS01063253.1.p1  ORF type:complete len:273 (+),score=11.41 GHVS01063253.1:373-1191(+)
MYVSPNRISAHSYLGSHGRVRLYDRSSRTYTYCGTYHAMAPELHTIAAALTSGRLEMTRRRLSSESADQQLLQANAHSSASSSDSPTLRREEQRHRRVDEPLSQDGNPWAGDLGYGFAVDWWSLGILTYEMIASAPPYGYQDFDNGRRETVSSLALSSPQHLDVNHVEVLDDSGRDFIRQLLQSKPSERLGTEDDMMEVKGHPWFHDFDWSRVRDSTVTSELPEHLGVDIREDAENWDVYESSRAYPSSGSSSDGEKGFVLDENGQDPFADF